MTRSLLLLALFLSVTAGCATKEALTAKATPCRVTEIDIVDSEFKRSGSTTAWCAKCRGKRYQCATDPSFNTVQCFEARPGTPCY